MTVHVSAIICTRNRPDLIGQAVASVLANEYPSFDLVVIDQSTDDRTGQTVRDLMAEHPNLRYVHSTTPGLSRAYNTGIRESSGPILAFTDDDCVAAPNWIAAHAKAFEVDPEVDIVYGEVRRATALIGVDGECPELLIPAPKRVSRRDGFRVIGMGANFAARREVFERVGGFDEALGGGGPLKSSQDYDFQYRVYRAGMTLLLNPDAKVEHYGLRTWPQWSATLHAYGFGDGAFYFKHLRCGDLFALKLLVRVLTVMGAREALSRLGLRRRPSRLEYLQSCLAGMWGSMRFQIDRRQRLYLVGPRA